MLLCRYIFIYLFTVNGKGKRTFVFLGRQTRNGNRGLLCQQTCPSMSTIPCKGGPFTPALYDLSFSFFVTRIFFSRPWNRLTATFARVSPYW